MEKHRLKPIFYDEHKKRWPRVKYGSLAAFFSIFLLFSLFVFTLLIDGHLKHITALPSLYHLHDVKPHSDNTSLPALALTDQVHKVGLEGRGLTENRFKKMAFLPNHDLTAMNSLRQNLSTLDVVFIGGAHLKTVDADIIEEEPNTLTSIVNDMHQQHPGTQAILVLDNELLPDISDFLANSIARKKAIQYELQYLNQHRFDGIIINFENTSAQNRDNLSLFMQELWTTLHPYNLSISINVYADDLAYDYQTLANSVDYEVLQLHDEHWINSAAGPLASVPWSSQVLMSHTRVIPHEKLVVGIANHGYDWKNEATSAQPITYLQAMALAKLANAKIAMDPHSLNPFFEYQEENNTLHHVWFLDAATLFNQCVIANSFQPYGIALWRLGSEDPSSWSVLQNSDFNQENALKLTTIDAKNALSMLGNSEGDIFVVHQGPEVGEREIEFDKESGLISAETYTKYPAPYIIQGQSIADKKKIALTFDDGPNAIYTPKILDILKATHTPATFFLIGRNILTNPQLARREIAEGHDIGNHTYTHPNITQISETTLAMELSSTKRILETSTSRSTLLFRAPFGTDAAPTTLKEIQPLVTVTKNGYYTVGTKIDPRDWSKPGTDVIVNRVLEQVHNFNNNVILLHDGGGMRQQTVDALPKIIATLNKEGYQFVTVSELMNIDRDILMPIQPPSWYLFLSRASFKLLNISSYIIPIIYIVGLVIVMLRFLVLTPLSLYQKIKNKLSVETFIDIDKFSLAVIVPAYNESVNIVRTIQSLLAAKRPKHFEIIVVNDGSTDNTLTILKEHFSDLPLIKILTQRNSGKAIALNNGLSHITADFLTIIDADTIIESDTLIHLMRPLHDPKVGAVAGNVRVANQGTLMAKWQILEYTTGQSLDRRALSVLDSVVVVPGALGCWRRAALLEAGGFTTDTLAEDADMTLKIKKLGYRIAVAEEAHAHTEVPETVEIFLRQRFRWMYGTYQVVWKHLNVFFRPRYGRLGFIALPNLFVVHVILPLIAPLTDLMLLTILLFYGVRACFGYTITTDDIVHLKSIALYYTLFTGVDLLTTLLAFLLDGKEKKRYLFWLIPQRFFYKQLIYFMAFRSILAVLHGREVWWGRMTRKLAVGT